MLKSALLVIGMLNDIVLEGSPLEEPATRGVIPKIKRDVERTMR